jgi:hypothetical protein
MASFTLGVVGALIAGPPGAVIGATLGAYIDQRFIIPKLSSTDDVTVDQASLGDINYFSADVGTECNYPIGSKCRSEGQLIYMLKPTTENLYTTQGKGGGSRPASPVYVYYRTNICVAFAVGKQIPESQFEKIQADGKLVWTYDQHLEVNNVSVYTMGLGNWMYVVKLWGNMSSQEQEDWAKFEVGQDCTLSGFSQSGNNGTFTLMGLYLDSGYAFWLFYNPSHVEPDYGGKVEQDFTGWTPIADSGTIYPGSTSQAKSSVILAKVPAEQVSAYRRCVYLELDDLLLKDFGNRAPRFTAFYAANPSPYSVKDAYEEILERYGLTSSEYDTVDLPSTEVYQYNIMGPQSASKVLQPLALAYDIIMQETNSKLRCFERIKAHVAEIDSDHLAAHEEGEEVPKACQVTDTDENQVPSEVRIDFYNIDKDNEKDSVNAQRVLIDMDENVQKYDIPIGLTEGQARNIARRLLYTPEEANRILLIRLPEKYFYIQEGDVIRFQAHGEEWNMLVTKKDWGLNAIIEFEGIVQKSYTLEYEAPPPTDEGDVYNYGRPPWPYQAAGVIFEILDFGPLIDEHAYIPGVYFVICPTHENVKWRGAEIHESVDGTNFEHVATLGYPAVMGKTEGTLGGGVNPGYWDYANEIEVWLRHGELESVTELECLNGLNRAIIGDEVIGFCNAVLQSWGVSPAPDIKKYKLSKLYRGLRNTEDEIGSHGANERFIFLSGRQGIHFHPLNQRALNTEREYKCVPTGGDPGDFSGVAHMHILGTIRPFSPDNLRGRRDASNNLSIAWDRRTRLVSRLFVGSGPPLEEPFEKYEIDVYDNGDVVRTIQVEDATSVIYTAAQQTTDGLTPGDPVHLKIYQISSIIGRGRAKDATL